MTAVASPPHSEAPRRLGLAQIRALLRLRPEPLVVIVLSVLAVAALEVLPPLIVGQVLDAHLAVRRSDGLLTLGFAYLLVVCAQQGLGFVSAYATAMAAQEALRNLRCALFAHLQRLPARYFDAVPLGDTVSRCTADIDAIEQLFASGIANLLGDVAKLATIAATMFLLSPELTMLSALTLVPVVGLTRWFQRRVLRAERASRQAIGSLNTVLAETLGGAEVVRAFGREAFFERRFGGAVQASLDSYVQATRYSAVYTPVMSMLAAIIVAVLLWSGAESALGGWGVSIGTLTAFVLLFRRFFIPISALGEEWQTVQGALSGAERVLQVLSLPADETTQALRATAVDTGPPAVLIQVEDVSFGYAGDRPVLHSVSLCVRAGEHVALVGRSGAGKSTLMHLVAGLYEPWSGRIRVNGMHPAAMSQQERRRYLGVVPQTLQLFSGSVLENLTMGDVMVTRDAVETAAKSAGAHSFILSLERGYDTPLGTNDGAVILSAGQRQLLALTRALVREPRVLLLDEATAAIDHASDAAFRAAIRGDRHASARAVLIVAHRLSTAREADRVIVLEEGQIVEHGEPADLGRRKGRFAALLALEAAGWDWHHR